MGNDKSRPIILLNSLLFLKATATLATDPPGIIAYQGRVSVNGVNFDSATAGNSGRFQFDLVSNGASTTYWTSGIVSLPVVKGLYTAQLGETNSIPSSFFAQNSEIYLRVSFSHLPSETLETLTPDHRIVSVGYAMRAGKAGDASSKQSNAGTNPASDFIGTTDRQPLVVKVDGSRALRIDRTSHNNFSTVNILAGSSSNSVGAGMIGATVAGEEATVPLPCQMGSTMIGERSVVGEETLLVVVNRPFRAGIATRRAAPSLPMSAGAHSIQSAPMER